MERLGNGDVDNNNGWKVLSEDNKGLSIMTSDEKRRIEPNKRVTVH